MSISPRSRSGFSLIELLIVVVIAGILLAIALPKTKTIRDKAAVRAAKQQVSSYFGVARAAAIRQSLSARVNLNGNVISAAVLNPNGTTTSVGGSIDIRTLRGVTLTKSPGSAVSGDEIVYDPRGFASGLAAPVIYIFTRNSSKDSVCITRLGLIARYCGQ